MQIRSHLCVPGIGAWISFGEPFCSLPQVSTQNLSWVPTTPKPDSPSLASMGSLCICHLFPLCSHCLLCLRSGNLDTKQLGLPCLLSSSWVRPMGDVSRTLEGNEQLGIVNRKDVQTRTEFVQEFIWAKLRIYAKDQDLKCCREWQLQFLSCIFGIKEWMYGRIPEGGRKQGGDCITG